MIYYIPGGESEQRFKLILSLTSIRSEAMIEAMAMHVVKGMDLETVELVTGVDTSNIRRSLAIFNDKLTVVEQIKEIDWVTR